MSSSRPPHVATSETKFTHDELNKWMNCDLHFLEPLRQEEGIPIPKAKERPTHDSTISLTLSQKTDVADVSTNFQISSLGTDVESCVTSSTRSEPQPPESVPMDTSPQSVVSTTSNNYETVEPVTPVEASAPIVDGPVHAPIEDPVNAFVENAVNAPVEDLLDALSANSVDVPAENPVDAHVEDFDDVPVEEPVITAVEIPVVEAVKTPVAKAIEIPVAADEALDPAPVDAVEAFEVAPIEAAAEALDVAPVEAAVEALDAVPVEAAIEALDAVPIKAAIETLDAAPVEALIAAPVKAPIATLATNPVVAAAAPKPKPSKQNGTGSPRKGVTAGKVVSSGVVSKKPSAPANATTTAPVKVTPTAASGSPARPSSRRASAPQTPTTPVDDANKKVPMNKVKVGAAAAPNIKEVRSKIGSFATVTHKPKVGHVKIPDQKLTWKAESKVGSLTNVHYVPKGGKVTVDTKKMESKKVETKEATSKIGSLQNVKHKPGGGEKKIFNDKEYLKKTHSTSSSEHGGSTPHTPRPSSCAANGTPLDVETNATLNNVSPSAGDQNLIDV